MGTKKKKSTRSFTRKKRRGGAHGLVLNIMYNKNNEIIDIQIQDILANKEYKDLNHIDPKYGFMDLLKDSMNFRDVMGNTHNFFHPFDQSLKTTRNRNIKLAVNDKRDIQLIKITNKIIRALNTYKNKSGKPFVFVRRNKRITPKSEEDFKHTYMVLLREIEGGILDKVGGGEEFRNVTKLMLRTPFLVNLVSIRFGLLRRGDIKMEEIRRMFGKTDELMDSLKLLKYEQPSEPFVGLDEIIEEENKKRQNRIMDKIEEINKIKNCAETGSCPLPTSSQQPSAKQPTNSQPPQSNQLQSNPQQSNPQQSNQPQSNPQQSNPQQSNPPQSNPPQSTQQTSSPQQATKVSTEQKDPDIAKIINEDKRLSALFQFNDLLLSFKELQTQPYISQIRDTRERFNNFLRGGKNDDPQLELQKYLIENLLAVLTIEATQLFEIQKVHIDSYKYQAIVLTLIRMLLSWDMKDYNKFKRSFDNFSITNTDICASSSTALNSLSFSASKFIGRRSYSYDTILSNLKDAVACNDFDKIITINLNKLYDMFKTKDIFYVLAMKEKSFKEDETTTTKYSSQIYDEKYDATNPNYIF